MKQGITSFWALKKTFMNVMYCKALSELPLMTSILDFNLVLTDMLCWTLGTKNHHSMS